MYVHVIAPGHPNFSDVEAYYANELTDKYEVYDFIKTMEVRIKSENNTFNIKLIASIERSPQVMAEDTDRIEHKAFKGALKKMDSLIRTYKSKHYHGI